MKNLTIDRFVQRYLEIDGPQGAEDPDYQSHVAWDSPILAVCREYPAHTSFAEVHCKVGYVNRLYKCVLGGQKDLLSWDLDEIESRVAKAFIDQGADAVMRDLSMLPKFTNNTLGDVVRCHSRLVKIVASVLERNERVFCSKYASFHFPEIVPILDSKSEKMARRLVSEVSGTNSSVEENDSQQDEEKSKRYENHCGSLLMLMELLQKKGIARPTLKKMDHVLYWR